MLEQQHVMDTRHGKLPTVHGGLSLYQHKCAAVTSLGLFVTGGPGPFRLELDQIFAVRTQELFTHQAAQSNPNDPGT